MNSQKQTTPKEQDPRQQFLIDVGRMYQFKPEEMMPDIKTSTYSNVSYLTCTNRDVFIDFLEMPGIKKDGKMMIPATRVYMSHSAAQQLAATLTGVLEGSYERGEMEFFTPPSGKIAAGTKTPVKKL
ncbi:MAG: DUF3467 domain-containing protein [Methanoregula sp.]